jgi:Myb-like DNA-binding protein
MPPKAVDDKQTIKFLLSILSQVTVGTLDWDRIVKENNIPTEGAARMRLRRLQASHKEGGGQTDNANDDEPKPPKPGKAAGAKKANKRQVKDAEEDDKPATKKNKAEQKVEDEGESQDGGEERELCVIDFTTEC